jgi:hypothetical protein
MDKKEDTYIKDENGGDIPLKNRVAELEKEVAELRAETNYERGLDRERLSVFYDYMDIKKSGRRDYDWEAAKLKKEVLKRERGMDYRDVRNFLTFKSDKEAYRVMERTIGNYPLDIEMKEVKYSNRRKKILLPR